MKIQNAIKKATKTLGIEPKICGNKYYFTKGNQELSFFENQKNARGLNIRWLNDKDDLQADYCAGTFFKNLDQALKCFNFNLFRKLKWKYFFAWIHYTVPTNFTIFYNSL